MGAARTWPSCGLHSIPKALRFRRAENEKRRGLGPRLSCNFNALKGQLTELAASEFALQCGHAQQQRAAQKQDAGRLRHRSSLCRHVSVRLEIIVSRGAAKCRDGNGEVLGQGVWVATCRSAALVDEFWGAIERSRPCRRRVGSGRCRALGGKEGVRAGEEGTIPGRDSTGYAAGRPADIRRI